jgi:hypothetical protein
MNNQRRPRINPAKTLILALLTTAPLIGGAHEAVAQSAYTSGTANSSAAAGYPSPSGYGPGLYAYVPHYEPYYAAPRRAWLSR